jgi:tetratricopeptide (TPR) repeat protein
MTTYLYSASSEHIIDLVFFLRVVEPAEDVAEECKYLLSMNHSYLTSENYRRPLLCNYFPAAVLTRVREKELPVMDGLESFDELLKKAQRSRNAADTSALLKFMRLNRIREPRLVVELGGRALRSLGRSLGDEKWPICEQVFIASLDTGDDDLSTECLTQLMAQFKESSRVKRLRGLEYEARREFKKAESVYKDLLEANPANALAMKRSASILKSQGDMKGAVKELNA